MSNRTRVDIYSRDASDRQSLSNLKRYKKRIGKGHASNIQRLSDIEKTIKGRRGGPRAATVLKWAMRYFRAGLPHIMASRSRVKAAGDPIEAVQAWALDQVGLLVIERGQEWIAEQARTCLDKSRRFPRIDRTNNIIDLQEGERKAYGIRSLSEKHRTKQVRAAEDRERRRQAEQGRRAQDPNHAPRIETKAAQIRAAGGNVNTVKSRERRARLAAEKAAAEAMHPSSCPDLVGVHPSSCPTFAEAVCTPVRALHLDTTRDRISAPSHEAPSADLRDTLDAMARLRAIPETLVDPYAGLEEFSPEWAAVFNRLECTPKAPAYIPLPYPTIDEQAATMASLRAGAAAASAAWLDLDPDWCRAFESDDHQVEAYHRQVA